MGVSGVGGAKSSQEIAKLDDLNEAKKTDRKQTEDQLKQQAEKAPNDAAQQVLAAQQAAQIAQLDQQNANKGPNALAGFDPGVQKAARGISAQVIAQMLGGSASAQTAETNTNTNTNTGGNPEAGADAAAQQSAAAALVRTAASVGGPSLGGSSSQQESGANAGGMGGASSQMGADQADEQIRNAAKVAVYDDIRKILNDMQNSRSAKADLEEKINSINQGLAGKKSGDKVKVPVYELDEAGNAKFKGYKEMDYDSAVAMRDSLQGRKDSIADLSQEQMFHLQQGMEMKSQLEQMISNVMKANSETQSGLAGNLKAS